MLNDRDYVLRTAHGYMILDLDNVENIQELPPSKELPTFKHVEINIKEQDEPFTVHVEDQDFRNVMFEWETPRLRAEYEEKMDSLKKDT
jgi:hypothetical protein